MAVIFCDADGTLLNSHEWMIDATLFTCSHYGIPITRGEIESNLQKGMSLHDFYRTFATHLDAEECARVHEDREEETLHLVTSYDGVRETLERLRVHGVSIAIVTGRVSHELLNVTLAQYNLIDFFSAIICRSDIKKNKPDPECIFLAASKMGLAITLTDQQLFMVGDSLVDIEAGKRAGIRTIGALYGFTGKALLNANADWYIRSFPEVLDIVLKKKG